MNTKNILCLLLFAFPFLLHSQEQSKLQALQINDKLIVNANAVVRHDEMSFKLVSQSEILIKRNRIVTVLNELGEKHIGAYVILDKYTEVKNIEALLYDEAGNEIKKFKQKNFVEESILEDVDLYSDHKLLKAQNMQTSYPYTVHFTYEVKTTNTAFIPKYNFIENYGVSVEEASCRINFNGDEFTVKEKADNFTEYMGKKYKIKGNITYSIMNFEALTQESLSPKFNVLTPSIQFAVNRFNFDNKNSDAITCGKLGMWYYNEILSQTGELPQEAINEAKTVAGKGANPKEQVELIYKYVKNNFKYIEANAMIGNYKPTHLEKVYMLKKGSSKDLINYTIALLKAIGIESYFVYAIDGIEKIDFDFDFPSLVQGNHAILCIPIDNELFWIDYSTEMWPFNFLGTNVDDRNVLVIKPTGGEIVRTPAYGDKDNFKLTKVECYLTSIGDIRSKVSIKTTGLEYGKHIEYIDKSKDIVVKKYKEHWKNINNISINDFSFLNNKNKLELTEEIDVSAPGYASISNNVLTFKVNLFSKDLFELERFPERKLDLQIKRGFFEKDELIIHIPEGYKVETLPKDKVIENEFGNYKVNFQKGENNTIIYRREFLVKENKYKKEKYIFYRSFRNQTSYIDDTELEFVKTRNL